MTTKRLRQGVKETHQHKCCGKNRKMEGSNNIVVYLCGVRARKSANLFTRRAICLQDGEGSNDNNYNYNLAFPRGGPERGNPAMTTKRLRQGVNETHQHKCCGYSVLWAFGLIGIQSYWYLVLLVFGLIGIWSYWFTDVSTEVFTGAFAGAFPDVFTDVLDDS